MAEKTPFELRLVMLQMSKEILERNFELQKEIAMKTWDTMIESAEKFETALPSKDIIASMMPKFPTLEEIVSQAEKMNDFVSGMTPKITTTKK